jgi:hypothetical protein
VAATRNGIDGNNHGGSSAAESAFVKRLAVNHCVRRKCLDRWVYFAESAEPFPAMLVEGSHAKAFAQHDEGDQ